MKKVFLLFGLIVLHSCNQAEKELVTMELMDRGRIEYNTRTGAIDLKTGEHLVVSDAYAAYKFNGNTYTVKDYGSFELEEQSLNDSLGKGRLYSLKFSKEGLPTLVHRFYTYEDLPYFLTELKLTGEALESNYLAPFLSGNVELSSRETLHTLFIPFDNDTFIRYRSKAIDSIQENYSAEVGVVFDNQSREGVVMGSLEHTQWKTGVKTAVESPENVQLSVWAGYTDPSITRDSIPHGTLKGDSIRSPRMFIGHFGDWRLGMEAYGKANRKVEPPYVFDWTAPTPVGWNSWGVIKDDLSYENATGATDFFADSLPEFRVGGTAFMDLDSFWDNMVQGGYEGDFEKITAFAEYCKEKGLTPGIYWAPFTDWGFRGGADRRAEGSEYTFGEMWTKHGDGYFDLDGARALDPTHPGTQARVKYVLGKLRESGYKMIKIDFLGHAAIESAAFYNEGITTGMQAYREGMEFLIDQLGDEMLLYAAISPSMATARYVHVRRIACDAWASIEDTEYTLNSVNFGWWQTYSYNFIDADHVVFAGEGMNANRARLASAVITGTLFTGDDFSKTGPWSATAQELLQNQELLKIVEHGVAFKPLEGNTGTGASEVFLRNIGEHLYVAVFNYSKEPKEYEIPLVELGLQAQQEYQALEIFDSAGLRFQDTLKITLEGEEARIFRIEKD